MNSSYCKYCEKEKPSDEFNKLPKNKCKSCINEYMQDRKRRLNELNGVFYLDCMDCGVSMKNPKSKLCQLCCRKTEKWDIKTASDFPLIKGDVTLCRLAFLIACGVDYQKFIDDCFTAEDAFNEEIQREPRVHVNDVDPYVVELYEENESRYFESRVLKEPLRSFQNERKAIND